MKLNAAQLRHVEEQLGTEAVAEDNPAVPKLKEAFGDHTFFLDDGGLNIVEPAPMAESASGNVIKLASWTENRNELVLHDPQVQPVTVDLGAKGPNPAT